jgi:hypothetical protein
MLVQPKVATAGDHRIAADAHLAPDPRPGHSFGAETTDLLVQIGIPADAVWVHRDLLSRATASSGAGESLAASPQPFGLGLCSTLHGLLATIEDAQTNALIRGR